MNPEIAEYEYEAGVPTYHTATSGGMYLGRPEAKWDYNSKLNLMRTFCDGPGSN
jgi:hypothetical protein